jgi:sugar (pentulose or hexulose) kinase
VARAVVEGVVREVAACVRRASEQAGPLEAVVAGGMGADRRWLLDLFQGAAGVPFIVGPAEEPSALGAAMLARMGRAS